METQTFSIHTEDGQSLTLSVQDFSSLLATLLHIQDKQSKKTFVPMERWETGKGSSGQIALSIWAAGIRRGYFFSPQDASYMWESLGHLLGILKADKSRMRLSS